jgi:hypothetical protein
MPSTTPNELSRRLLLGALATLPTLPGLLGASEVQAQTAPLASWNDSPAKQAILDFVHDTTESSSKEALLYMVFVAKKLASSTL